MDVLGDSADAVVIQVAFVMVVERRVVGDAVERFSIIFQPVDLVSGCEKGFSHQRESTPSKRSFVVPGDCQSGALWSPVIVKVKLCCPRSPVVGLFRGG